MNLALSQKATYLIYDIILLHNAFFRLPKKKKRTNILEKRQNRKNVYKRVREQQHFLHIIFLAAETRTVENVVIDSSSFEVTA